MKKILFGFISLALAFNLCGCNDANDNDGRWNAIKTDKNEVVIPCSGGTDTICTNNYSSWWICEVIGTIDGSSIIRKPIQTDEDSCTFTCTYGIWYTLTVPAEHRNMLVIKIEKNNKQQSRTIKVMMESGDAFKTINITQENK